MAKKDKILFHYDMKLDLHGYFVEDAIIELDRLLSKNPNTSVMIIHGRGEGKLRKGLRDYLNNNKIVREVHFGEDLNIPGSDGVTIVYT